MATRGRRDIVICKLGGTLGDAFAYNYAFYAPKDSYKNIAAALGCKVQSIGRGTKGLSFGVNNIKPAKIRISYLDRDLGGGTANDNVRTVLRFCAWDQLDNVILGAALDRKKIHVDGHDYDIQNVTLVTG